MKRSMLVFVLLTGCASGSGAQYTMGDYFMMFLQAKANSHSTQDAYNRGLSSSQPQRNQSVINQIDLQRANPYFGE